MQKSNLILLFGENTFEIHQKVQYWKKGFIEKYGNDLNIDEMDGSKKVTEILEACYTMPFLSEKRLVIVKNIFSEQKTEALKKLSEKLESIPETCVFIMVEEGNPDKRTSLFKKIQSLGRIEECKPLLGDHLIRWILDKTKELGGNIDWSTASHLTMMVGTDLWKLKSDIEKLCAYSEGALIDKAMVKTLVSESAITTSIFKLTDELGQKRPSEALKILHQLLQNDEALPMIFSMLARQFRLLIQVQELQQMGQSPSQIANRLKQHPYAISSLLPQGKNFTTEELKRIHRKLIHMDRDLKTGEIKFTNSDQTEYLLEIEKLIIESCL